MKDGMEVVLENTAGREGVRHVLSAQYALHEAKHHSECGCGEAERVPTVPKAHTLADIYKCLHQGQFGVGHSIEDPVKFANLLTMELARAEANYAEPVLENVSPAGFFFRVNLRPYRRMFAGRDEFASRLLAGLCLSSAETQVGSLRDFIMSMEWFRDLNKSGELSVRGRSYMFPGELVDLFLEEVNDFVRSMGSVPVLSHSTVYKRFNAPSYRVVDRAILERSALAPLLQDAQ
jgi:hypothetical protein